MFFVSNDVATALKTFLENFAKNSLTIFKVEMWFLVLTRF